MNLFLWRVLIFNSEVKTYLFMCHWGIVNTSQITTLKLKQSSVVCLFSSFSDFCVYVISSFLL